MALKLVEERVYDEQEQVAAERASYGESGPILDSLGNDALEDEVDRGRKKGKEEALELQREARGGETPSQAPPRIVEKKTFFSIFFFFLFLIFFFFLKTERPRDSGASPGRSFLEKV